MENVVQGNVKKIEKMLDSGVDPNFITEDGSKCIATEWVMQELKKVKTKLAVAFLVYRYTKCIIICVYVVYFSITDFL